MLKRTVNQATEMGFQFNCGPEVEFFLFDNGRGTTEPVPHDVGGYFDFSPRDRAARLDIGSDDGVKAWLNGKLVHGNNALRGVGVAQEKVKVSP